MPKKLILLFSFQHEFQIIYFSYGEKKKTISYMVFLNSKHLPPTQTLEGLNSRISVHDWASIWKKKKK